MGNVKGHFLRVDWVNTPKVREAHTQIQQYADPYNLGDFTSDDDIPNMRTVYTLIAGIPTPPTPVFVIKNIAPGLADVYTLDAGELADVNAIGRYPNFVAVLAATGEYATDIVPKCLGVAGGFTSVTVALHSDGMGNNPDDTIIQFS